LGVGLIPKFSSGWGINWVSKAGDGNARLKIQDFKSVGKWVIGGFGMGIVQGLVHYNGQDYSAYGFAELNM